MLTVIILGLILFIGGVGFTIIHDKYKEHSTATKTKMAVKAKLKEEALVAARLAKTEHNKMFASLFDDLKKPLKPSKNSSKRIVKPGSAKTGYHKQMPTAEDGSINSTLSLEELIQKIESMKKR